LRNRHLARLTSDVLSPFITTCAPDASTPAAFPPVPITLPPPGPGDPKLEHAKIDSGFNRSWYLLTTGKYPELKPSPLAWFVTVSSDGRRLTI
jgi:hypothetical protein